MEVNLKVNLIRLFDLVDEQKFNMAAKSRKAI
jgi:hypothetical protein